MNNYLSFPPENCVYLQFSATTDRLYDDETENRQIFLNNACETDRIIGND